MRLVVVCAYRNTELLIHGLATSFSWQTYAGRLGALQLGHNMTLVGTNGQTSGAHI